QPRGQFLLLAVLAHEDLVHPRRHVPIDPAHLVPRLVRPHLGEVQTGTVKQARVVAEEKPVQPANDLKLEAPQDSLGCLHTDLRCGPWEMVRRRSRAAGDDRRSRPGPAPHTTTGTGGGAPPARDLARLPASHTPDPSAGRAPSRR